MAWNQASLYPDYMQNSLREETIVPTEVANILENGSEKLNTTKKSIGLWFVLLLAVLVIIGVIHF